MDHEPANDLLAHADVLGDAVATVDVAAPARAGSAVDLPMSEDQAAFIAYLCRRMGRDHEPVELTFQEAKRCIAGLLEELAS